MEMLLRTIKLSVGSVVLNAKPIYPITEKGDGQKRIKVRIEARKHYFNGEEWDTFAITNNINKCSSCEDFIMALRNGSLALEPTSDPEQEKKNREEGYCSLKEWNDRMNEFLSGAQSEPDLEERLFRGMRECCPLCGTNLIDGKCPRCG
jgi:hypothetical protein